MTDQMHNPVAHHLGYRMRRASVALMAKAGRTAEERGLSITLGTVLILISANPGCRQRDLCAELGIKRANMTPIVADLETRGLLDRAAIDGRSQAMRLTPKGAALAQELLAALEATEQSIDSHFAPGELDQLRDLAQRLEEAMAQDHP
ncbi:MarR family winged helix-turn-helix transcriptional regulator [Sphingomonas sp. BGYR3]|uniref:MarR family winged helix-turn-helix transcriptional regulator n=1 Tax=Sphingomonas sp. BGYR3 TaxID=2975483 RepID=UPI0021A3842B|nr:MarR family winged helix-turn-helix transcriptional regulator [Sphingomonas sp. BGYR3]MDG5489688.1 MarR family winged helix-turn-helix transcriptional regulator [Sphingomonas sp. BGYR3]